MKLLCLLIRAVTLLLFAAFGSVAAFAAPGDWTRVGYPIVAQELSAQPVNLAYTARAPPTRPSRPEADEVERPFSTGSIENAAIAFGRLPSQVFGKDFKGFISYD